MSAPTQQPTPTDGGPAAGGPPRGAGRAAITNAAREIFAERGYHGTSIRDIAARAGLSLSALYHWHSSKQDLLAALLWEGTNDYFEACERELAAAGDDPTQRLRAMVRSSVAYRVRRRVESKIIAQEWRNLEPEHQERLNELADAATRLWTDIIADGIRRGVFHCAHPEDARRTVVAACNAIAQWYDPAGEVDLEELIARYTDIALRVVDARGS
ncbi:TetR/AcrR family transcriptional regulator [Pseudonocardia eucalypti]|uniref:TetR/AcrR family transcriptional regulator n=1 Tax=Pseudonocardia eucalypti TaxID=648755 RepID=A0ABP9R9B0_9PSEU|nr:AcrR family transcriptional regulator [Pseudonocardia eucalypti]